MKVLIVSQFFYPESFRINHLAQELVARGHEVTVLTGQPNYPGGRIYEGYGATRWNDKWQGLRIVRVPVFPRGKGRALELILNYLSFVFFATLFGLPRLSRPDVCLVWSSSPITSALPAIWFARARGVSVSIWIQDLWPESFSAITRVRSSFVLWPLRKIVSYVYARCDQIWIQSKAFSESVIRHGGAEAKLHYVPNWAEDFYDRALAPSAAEQNEIAPGFSILFAGNLGQAQALDTALAAVEQLGSESPATWYFVGDGSMRTWLDDEIAKRSLRSKIKILSPRDASRMPELFKQAKVLFVSLTNDAVFDLTVPSKIQSYLASGKPILASLNGEGARLLRESGSSLVSAAGDATGLADSVRELLKLNDRQLSEMGDRSYELYRSQFQARTLIDRAEALLLENLA